MFTTLQKHITSWGALAARKPLVSKRISHWVIPVIAMLALISGCADNTQEDNTKQAEIHQKTANSYIKQGQFRAAIIEARNVIKYSPASSDGYITLAAIYNDIGSSASAIEILEPLAGKDSAATLPLAEAYVLSGKFNSAQQLLDTATDNSSDKDREQYALLQAKVYIAEQQFDQARDALVQIATQSPNYIDAQLSLAQIDLINGNIARAKKLLSQLLIDNSQNSELLHLRAQTAYIENNLDDAERFLTDALTYLPQTDIITPLKTRVLQQLSETLTQQGRTTEALIYTRLLAEANPEGHQAKQTLNQAMALYQAGELDEAEQLLLKLYEQYPNNSVSGMLLGMINYQQGDMTKAGALLEQNIDPEIASSNVISSAAMAQLRLGQSDKAIALLQEALKTQPNDAGINAIYGLALLTTNVKDQQGAVALQKALALDPEKSQLRSVLARHFIAIQKLQQAYAQLTTALEKNPADNEAFRVYIDALLSNQSLAQAQQLAETFVQNNPDNADGYIQQAKVNVAANDLAGAEKSLTKAVAVDSNNTQAMLGLGQLNFSNKQWQQAERHFRDVIAIDKNNTIAYKGLISSFEARQQGADIIDELNKTATTEPDNYILAAILAEFYARGNNAELAEQFIDKALVTTRENAYVNATAVSLYRGLSKQLAAANDLNKAKSKLLKAIDIDTDNTTLLTDLVIIELAANSYSQAEQVTKKIRTLVPDSPLADYLKGQIYAAQQQWSEAIRHLRLAWQIKPNNSIATSLYDALTANNNKDQAQLFIDEWQRLIPQSPAPLIIKATQQQQQGNVAEAMDLYEKALSLSPNNLIALNNLAWLYFENGNPKARELGK
ncbi:MAG: tetratricopeptide repeat protein, partial [Oceanicoccus sp.]